MPSNIPVKGVLKDLLPVIILLAGFLIIMIIIFVTMFRSADREIDETKCRTSILTSSVVSGLVKDLAPVSLACQPILRQLPDEEQKIYITIAKDIDRCYDRWFTRDGKTHQLFAEDGVFCVPCVIYTFKEPEKQYSDLLKTLVTYPNENEPVMDKLVSVKGDDRTDLYQRINKEELTVESLDSSNAYVIMYAQAHGDTYIQNLLSGHRSQAGTTGGILLMTGVGMTGSASVLAFIASTNPVGWIAGGLVLAGLGAYTLYETFKPVINPDPINNPAVLMFRKYDAQTLTDIGCTVAPQPNDYRKGPMPQDWAKQ